MTIREDLEHLFASTWESDSAFQAAWGRFAMRQDHTVTMIEPPLSATQQWLLPHMNCFAYALRLHELPAYHRWIREHHSLDLLDGGFMEDLIEQRWLAVVATNAPRLGKLVVYKRLDDHVTHSGIIVDGQERVRSKFNINEFYEHGLLEVQTSFGEPQWFLEPPTEQVRCRIMEELVAAAKG
jgi:hypothetical protein